MTKNKEKKAQQAKDTGLALVLILLIVILVTGKTVYVLPALILQVITMTWPAAFGPLSYVWFGFSKILGEVVSRILLTLIFFFIAVPIGTIRNISGADSMKIKKWQRSQDSIFTERDHTYQPSDLERPY